MSWRRAKKTSGWAAFDPKKQQKEVTNNETHNNPYPPISSNIRTREHHHKPSRNSDLPERSFSSVLTHSTSLPHMMASEDNHSPFNVADIQNVPNFVAFRGVPNIVHTNNSTENRQGEKMTAKYIENHVSQLYEMLKELHPWANENLIEDIMAAVDYDIEKASSLLREMASPTGLQEKKEVECTDNFSELYVSNCVPHDMDLRAGDATTFRESIHNSQDSVVSNHDKLLDDHAFSGKVHLDDDVTLGLLMDSLSMIPIEPEWEDDDLYLMHRKEAIRAMRLASRYSKAATSAYLRKDHAAAEEFSIKAQEEWSTSEKLNAKAAKEIVAIRNSENDDWKLDLHGLHATEAVQVLQEHLSKIESQVSVTHCTKPDKANLTVAGSETENLARQQKLSRPRMLEVITGKGNHSQGQAVLPVAIKSFLSEKRYYFYEARIGVIAVLPKFRQPSTALLKT